MNERLEKLKELKCQNAGCYNYSMRGIIYCERCYIGSPSRLSDEDIKLLKENGL